MSKIGSLLKETRESKNLSLSDVNKETRISVVILEKIENGEFYDLPSYTHARGFFVKYAQFLELSVEDLKSDFQAECHKDAFSGSNNNLSTEIDNVNNEQYKKPFPAMKVTLFILIPVVVIAAFFYIQYINKEKIKDITADNVTIENKSVNKTQALAVDNISDNKTDNATALNRDNLTDNATDNKSDNKTALSTGKPNKLAENVTRKKETTGEIKKEEKIPEKKQIVKNNKVKIAFSDVCWVHINIDNKKSLDFIAEKDSSRIINFNDFFIIDIGNAAAVKIYHGKDVYGKFGKYRQPVKHLKFTVDKDNKLVFTKIK